jgi:hypothetical protein
MLLIQEIKTVWTKQTRGAKGSTLRNKLPNAFEVKTPHAGVNAIDCLHQLIIFREAEAFKQPYHTVKTLALKPTQRFGIAHIQPLVDTYQVVFDFDSYYSYQDYKKPTVVELVLDKFLQVAYQARLQQFDNAWYEKTVLNIAWVDRFDSTIFTHGKPLAKYEHYPILY